MIYHAYKNTNLGLVRVNNNPLTHKEATTMLELNGHLMIRDAEATNYALLHHLPAVDDEKGNRALSAAYGINEAKHAVRDVLANCGISCF